MWRKSKLSLVLGLVSTQSLAAEGPFSDVPWHEAREQDGAVFFEISKAGACEEDSWSSPEVRAWLKSHRATAVYLDRKRSSGPIRKLVDGGREVVSMRLGFRDGVEVDRACGCMTPDSLSKWLDLVSEGKTLASAERARLGDPTEGALDVAGELEIVRLQYCANRLGEALDGLIYLWDEIPTRAPDHRDIRLLRVAHDMAVLARASDEVTARVTALRDSLEEGKDTDFALLDDWVALNRVLLQDDHTLAWYDEHKNDDWYAKFIAHQAPNLFFLLAERGSWKDAGSVIDDPQSWLVRWKPEVGGLEQAIWGYAALMAADRKREAGQFARELLRATPDDTACSLVEQSIKAGAADKSQKKWVKDCADEGLTARWSEALP